MHLATASGSEQIQRYQQDLKKITFEKLGGRNRNSQQTGLAEKTHAVQTEKIAAAKNVTRETWGSHNGRGEVALNFAG